MILGLITLKHSLGILILSFETPNPDLVYIPKKPILIECGYLDWRVFFLEKFLFFIINRAVVFFPQPKFLVNYSPVRDEFFECIIGQSKNEKE